MRSVGHAVSMKNREMYTQFWLKNIKVKYHLWRIAVDENIILKLIWQVQRMWGWFVRGIKRVQDTMEWRNAVKKATKFRVQ
jgi:hypothetical protein